MERGFESLLADVRDIEKRVKRNVLSEWMAEFWNASDHPEYMRMCWNQYQVGTSITGRPEKA